MTNTEQKMINYLQAKMDKFKALEARYGFEDREVQQLLETFSDGTYMLFRVGVVEYRFESHYKSDGTLWIDEYCVSRI